VQRGRRLPRIELHVALDGLCGREYLDVDPAGPQRLERARIGSQLPVRAGAGEQALGELVEHLVEILEHEPVPLLPPPAAHHPLRKHNDVARLLTSVDRHAPEAVAFDLGHRLDRSARANERHECER
jgi:hypothetical protein